MKKKVPCLPILLMLFAHNLFAQDFSFVHYNEKDGLPSNTVYSVTQDRNGFIWFATENGLCRFDGARFKNYTTKEGLPDNAILKVFAHKSGKLYFSPFMHAPYYLENDSVHKLKCTPEDHVNLVQAGQYFNNGNRLVLNIEGMYSYMIRPDDSIVPTHRIYPFLKKHTVVRGATDTSFMVGPFSDLWVVHNDNRIIRRFAVTKENCLAFTRERAIPNPANFEQATGGIVGVTNDSIGFLRVEDSLYFFDAYTGKTLYQTIIDKPSDCLIDNEKNIWITTLGNGIYRIPSFAFRHLQFDESIRELHSLAVAGNTILAGTNYSYIYKLGNNDIVVVKDQVSYKYLAPLSSNPLTSSLNMNRFTRLVVRKDTLYAAADGWLLKITPSNVRMCPAYPVKDIDTIGGKLLVSTGHGVYLVNADNMAIEDTLIGGRTSTGVYYEGNYYVGAVGKLVKINARSAEVTDMSTLHPAFKSRIVSVLRGTDNDLWIATGGQGLVHYKKDRVLKVYSTANGMTSDICSALLVDTSAIWVGTNAGLNKLPTTGSSQKIITFTKANGLVVEFVASLAVRGNTIFVGSNAGLTYFDKRLDATYSICLLNITGVSQGNRTLAIDSVYTFPYNALNIKVDFTAISFKSAGNNTYYYMLEGLDTGWNNTTNTFINYPTLPAGKYRLLIRAVNKLGVESQTLSIYITITPPWWQTWWFITIAAFSFATAVFLLYRRNINAIKKREKIKRTNEAKFAALEQQALQAQMNPHFIFNSLNSIQSFILDLDAEGANQYLSAFASMIRQTLDISSHPLITVADETRYLDTYLQLEKLRFREKFNYQVQVDEEVDTFNTWIPGMLLQPFVENSLRHGIQHRNDNNGMILVEIKPFDATGIMCSISDNGVGRKRAEEIKSSRHIEYQSKGTSIANKRVKTINNQYNTNIHITTSDIVDESGGVAGTLVTIIIPELRKT